MMNGTILFADKIQYGEIVKVELLANGCRDAYVKVLEGKFKGKEMCVDTCHLYTEEAIKNLKDTIKECKENNWEYRMINNDTLIITRNNSVVKYINVYTLEEV